MDTTQKGQVTVSAQTDATNPGEGRPRRQRSTPAPTTMLAPGEAATKHVIDAFVQAVSAIPHVSMVLVEESGQYPRVWTVIAAPPFDNAYSRPVYAAQMLVSEREDQPVVDFRLLNINELAAPLGTVVPAHHRAAYQQSVPR